MAFVGIPQGDQIDQLFKEFLDVASDESQWTPSGEKLGVKVTQKKLPSSDFLIIKGEGVIKATPLAVKDLLWDMNQRGKWDLLFDSGKIVQELKKDEQVVAYYRTKSTTVVWPRDFSIFTATRKEANDGYTLIARSIEIPILPNDVNCVRAIVLLCGFTLQPLDNGSSTKVTYIFQVDGGGWIPSTVQNSANQMQPFGILGMRKILTGTNQP